MNAVFSSNLKRIDSYIKISDNPKIKEEVEKMSGLGTMIAKENYDMGISQGISRGESMLGKLIKCLMEDGKTEDIDKVATDEAARKELYKHYGIIDQTL